MKAAKKMKTTKKRSTIFLLSYLTVLGFRVNLGAINSEEALGIQLLKALGGFSVTQLFLLAGICVLYSCAFEHLGSQRWTTRDKACVIIPAVLFSAFMVIGASFVKTNSLDLALGSVAQILKSLIALVGHSIGFSVSIAWLYTCLDGATLFGAPKRLSKKTILGRYKSALVKYPVRTAFLSLLILYIPYVILSYPAVFMGGDPRNIILQGFNLPDGTSKYLNLIDENVKLNGHHPVVYTMFVHVCLVFGKSVFGSYNAGIFLVAFSQLLGTCFSVALSICLLVKLNVHENILIGLLLYFAFSPRLQNYMFLITKDIWTASMLLLYLLAAFHILRQPHIQRETLAEFVLFGIAVGLLRNDGKYIILGSIVVMLLLVKERRKTLLISGVIIAVALGSFSNVLMPALHITPTSRREALSVPFQQTARYFRDQEQDVTPAERAAVSAVLDADSIGEIYDPVLADPVKATFREDATAQELATYFNTWFKMGLKHPGIYVQATLNNYYGYFYPEAESARLYSYSWSANRAETINTYKDLQEIGVAFHYPESLDAARTTFETWRENLFNLPVLSVLKCPAAYVWALMLLAFYLIKKRAWSALALAVPLVLSVCICFLGPCNGAYFRYLYGVSVCLPVVYLLCLSLTPGKDPAKK